VSVRLNYKLNEVEFYTTTKTNYIDMNFFDRLFNTKQRLNLEKLIETNKNGMNRTEILGCLRTEMLHIGTNKDMKGKVIDSKTKIDYLTSSAPQNTGFVLLTFLTESLLKERNNDAFSLYIDLNAIKIILNSSDLIGIVIISKTSWVYFPREVL